MCETCDPLTSPRAKCISGPKKFRSSPQKDFFNTIDRSRLGHAKSPENLHKIETGFLAMMSTLHFAVVLRCWQTVALPLYLYLRRLWGDDTQEVVVVANRHYGFHLAMLVLVVFHRDRPFRL